MLFKDNRFNVCIGATLRTQRRSWYRDITTPRDVLSAKTFDHFFIFFIWMTPFFSFNNNVISTTTNATESLSSHCSKKNTHSAKIHRSSARPDVEIDPKIIFINYAWNE